MLRPSEWLAFVSAVALCVRLCCYVRFNRAWALCFHPLSLQMQPGMLLSSSSSSSAPYQTVPYRYVPWPFAPHCIVSYCPVQYWYTATCTVPVRTTRTVLDTVDAIPLHMLPRTVSRRLYRTGTLPYHSHRAWDHRYVSTKQSSFPSNPLEPAQNKAIDCNRREHIVPS
jgi:hypothetical protein